MQHQSLFLVLQHLQRLLLVEALHHTLPRVDEPVIDLVNAQLRLLGHFYFLGVGGIRVRKVLEQPFLQHKCRFYWDFAVPSFSTILLPNFLL